MFSVDSILRVIDIMTLSPLVSLGVLAGVAVSVHHYELLDEQGFSFLS
jgi:hypothetical protein